MLQISKLTALLILTAALTLSNFQVMGQINQTIENELDIATPGANYVRKFVNQNLKPKFKDENGVTHTYDETEWNYVTINYNDTFETNLAYPNFSRKIFAVIPEGYVLAKFQVQINESFKPIESSISLLISNKDWADDFSLHTLLYCNPSGIQQIYDVTDNRIVTTLFAYLYLDVELTQGSITIAYSLKKSAF